MYAYKIQGTPTTLTTMDSDLISLKSSLAREFIESKSFKHDSVNQFTLSSGHLSPFYVDCKGLMAYPKCRSLVARLAFEQIKEIPFKCIGGLEIGAISIATTISDYAYQVSHNNNWLTFVVRKGTKGYGLNKLIEGAAKPGDSVLIVDDVLTSGGSVIKAISAARDFGLKVDYAMVIVDRNERNGRENVEKENVHLISLLTINDLLLQESFLTNVK